jgi:putative transposase
MPRQPRLDAPGTWHHVMGRGLERTQIFHTDTDRADFVSRLSALARDGQWSIAAWALLPNHFHLLVRTGAQPLSRSMKKLLTGYVVNFNRRHHRAGHLFQNRYKSIVVEEEPYVLELTRYIHLNPLRAGLVERLAELRRYPWSGHAALLGRGDHPWQDTRTVLASFGKKPKRARKRYDQFVQEGIPQGRRPELVGGGLIRSLGGWSQVVALRGKGVPIAADPRILGSGTFTESLVAEADRQARDTLRLARQRVELPTLLRTVSTRAGIPERALRSGRRQPDVVRARRLFCQVAVQGLGYSGAAVARFLGVTTSSVNRLAASEELPEVKKYLKAL